VEIDILKPCAGEDCYSVSDGVDAPTQRHLCAKMVVLEPFEGRASMEKISIIGLDLAKRIIQVHGARADGAVLFR